MLAGRPGIGGEQGQEIQIRRHFRHHLDGRGRVEGHSGFSATRVNCLDHGVEVRSGLGMNRQPVGARREEFLDIAFRALH